MKAKWKPWKPGSSKREFSWTVEFYYFIKEQLISLLGFREKTIREFINEYERLGYKAPRPIKGREKAFVFTANGLTVIVYTTFDEKNWCWREKGTDQMWVIIVKGDLLKFSNPIKRTKYCHEYLIDYAAIRQKISYGRKEKAENDIDGSRKWKGNLLAGPESVESSGK